MTTTMQLATRVARLEGLAQKLRVGENATVVVQRELKQRCDMLRDQARIDKQCIMELERRVGEHTEWLEALGRHDDHHTSDIRGIHTQLKDWKEAPAAEPAEPAVREALASILLKTPFSDVAGIINRTWSRESRIDFIKLLAGDL